MKTTFMAAIVFLGAVSSQGGAIAQDVSAERTFAFIQLGPSYEDVCANLTGGATRCPTVFGNKTIRHGENGEYYNVILSDDYCTVTIKAGPTPNNMQYELVLKMKDITDITNAGISKDNGVTSISYYLVGNNAIQENGKKGDKVSFAHRYRNKDIAGNEMQKYADVFKRMEKALAYYHLNYCKANPF